jgi:hypothetical protein
VTTFRFIAAKKAEHSVKTMCRVLGVSRSGFHAWTARQPSARQLDDERLLERIREIHNDTRKVMGRPGSTPSCAWATASGSAASAWSG